MMDTAETKRRYDLATSRRYMVSLGALAILLACGLAAALLTAGPASPASRGFKVENNSSRDLQLVKVERVPTVVCVNPNIRCVGSEHDMAFEGRPADGAVLSPGRSHQWELKYSWSPIGGVQYAANLWYRIEGTDDLAQYTIYTYPYSNESFCNIRGTAKFGCGAAGTKLEFRSQGPG
jgi:hypothetical protein